MHKWSGLRYAEVLIVARQKTEFDFFSYLRWSLAVSPYRMAYDMYQGYRLDLR
jgi:hypothetical protein